MNRLLSKYVSALLSALMLLAAGLTGGGAVHAQQPAMGRLFFSPQQRQELDRRRASNAQTAAAIPVQDLVTVNGRVSRSSGKTTTWINGSAQEDTHRGPDASRITLPAADESPAASLRVGETLDRVKGETRGGIGDGSITVRRSTR